MWTGRKGTFWPYQPPESQRRGGVTRRAVAKRRRRGSALARLFPEAISGVWFSGVYPQQDGFGSWVFDPVDLSTVVVAPTTCKGVPKARGKLPGFTQACGNRRVCGVAAFPRRLAW